MLFRSEDLPDEKLEEEYAPLKVEHKARIAGSVDVMPCDRMLVAE